MKHPCLIPPLTLALACQTPTEKDNPTCTETGMDLGFLMRSIQFSTLENNVVNGFDIDNRESDSDDRNGCFQPDSIDSFGSTGIDNAISKVLDEFQSSETGAIGSYLDYTVLNGELLVLLRVIGVDNLTDDDCVAVELLRVQGPVLVDLNNNLLDGQTLARHENHLSPTYGQGRIENGILTAEGLAIELEIKAEEFQYPFSVENAQLRMPINTVENPKGYFGGAGPVEDYFFISEFDQTSYTDLIQQRIYDMADIAPDEYGICQHLSSAYDFEAISAHLFVDEP